MSTSAAHPLKALEPKCTRRQCQEIKPKRRPPGRKSSALTVTPRQILADYGQQMAQADRDICPRAGLQCEKVAALRPRQPCEANSWNVKLNGPLFSPAQESSILHARPNGVAQPARCSSLQTAASCRAQATARHGRATQKRAGAGVSREKHAPTQRSHLAMSRIPTKGIIPHPLGEQRAPQVQNHWSKCSTSTGRGERFFIIDLKTSTGPESRTPPQGRRAIPQEGRAARRHEASVALGVKFRGTQIAGRIMGTQ
ncbi:unnamed protein product [Lampetra fluviatilis]